MQKRVGVVKAVTGTDLHMKIRYAQRSMSSSMHSGECCQGTTTRRVTPACWPQDLVMALTDCIYPIAECPKGFVHAHVSHSQV